MRKFILSLTVATLLLGSAAMAQNVNREGINKKIDKITETTKDAKKGAKASTWISLGKAYYEAAIEPTKALYVGMEQMMLSLTCGAELSSEKVVVNGVEATALTYPYFVAYAKDGKIYAWKQTKNVKRNALQKSFEAYQKAYELDPKAASKIKKGLQDIVNFCAQVGNLSIDAADYKTGAEAYELAYNIQSHPAFGSVKENAYIYYAGYVYTVDGTTNSSSFSKGAECLETALTNNYADKDGNIYYYLFHCYYGQKAADKANLIKAKDALLRGMEKFPKNEKMLDGLMELYTTEEGVGNPADLITLIEKSLSENPDNIDMWYGRGRVYNKLKNYDETIKSFEKVVELAPEAFDSYYYLGLFRILKGDSIEEDNLKKSYSNDADYKADTQKATDAYMTAIAPLEKAYSIDPNNIDAVNLLKPLCFRLRDEKGMMDKYKFYEARLKEMEAATAPQQ